MTVHDYKNATVKLNQFHDYSKGLFEHVITYQGNPGMWYHGGDDPLQHLWHTFGNTSICKICSRTVEQRRILILK